MESQEIDASLSRNDWLSILTVLNVVEESDLVDDDPDLTDEIGELREKLLRQISDD